MIQTSKIKTTPSRQVEEKTEATITSRHEQGHRCLPKSTINKEKGVTLNKKPKSYRRRDRIRGYIKKATSSCDKFTYRTITRLQTSGTLHLNPDRSKTYDKRLAVTLLDRLLQEEQSSGSPSFDLLYANIKARVAIKPSTKTHCRRTRRRHRLQQLGHPSRLHPQRRALPSQLHHRYCC